MAKTLDNLKINELIELKQATDMLCDIYAKELTTYAEMQSDRMFQNISSIEMNKIQTHKKYSDLSEKIKGKIEEKVNEYC